MRYFASVIQEFPRSFTVPAFRGNFGQSSDKHTAIIGSTYTKFSADCRLSSADASLSSCCESRTPLIQCKYACD